MTDQRTTLAGNRHARLILLIGILSLALVAAYFEILAWVVKGWFSFDRSYSLLILLLSIFMVWTRRDTILRTPAEPSLVLGSVLTLAGCLIVVAGRLSNTLMVQGISLVVVLLGLILLLLGAKHFKMLFIPVGYLFFMFYFLEELLGRLSHYLQLASAWIAACLIGATGMPVALQGYLIELPHISLEVAKVCNGVNHIVALAAMSVPFAFLSQKSTLGKGLIVLGAFLVGLFSNGLRVALIGYWTKYHPDGPLHGPFDIFYVSFILIFGLVFFGLQTMLSRRWSKGKISNVATHPSPVKEPLIVPKFGSKKQWAAVLTALAILFLANAYIYLHTPMPVEPKRDLSEFPMQIGPWEGKAVADQEWPAKHLAADVELRRIYHHPSGSEVGLYIGYFRTQEQGKELINYRLGWLHLKAEEVSLSQGSDEIKIMKGVARGLSDQTYQGDRRVFYFWYQIDDRIYLDQYRAKIALVLNNLLNRRSNGALVLVSDETGNGSDSDKRARTIGFLEKIMTIIPSYF